jgi:flagellar biosynthesis protein FlhG
MRDDGLLPEVADDEAAQRGPSRAKERRTIAIAGPKGGVGKTVIGSNLAIFLASIGRRVVVVDADGDGANMHTMLGVDRPAHGAVLADVAPGRVPVLETPVPGLSLVHGGIDEPAIGETRRGSRRRLRERLEGVPADYVVMDLGSGTHRSALDLWLDANVGVFVTLPEPTALDGTYRFVRAAFARFLRRRAPDPETRRRLVARLRAMGNTPAPLDLARRLEAHGDPLSDLVRRAMDDFELRFVLNQTRVRADLELGEAICVAARRRLGVRFEYLGYVDHDDAVWTCVRMRRPVLVESPGTKASKSIEKIARRVLAIDSGKGGPRPLRPVPPESHHDLLEVERGATDEEIRRAFKRTKEIYSHDSLCCYGLFDRQAMESLRARLEEAYDVLLDPSLRRPYELSVFPAAPEPALAPASDKSDEPKPPPPLITPETEFTGALVRAVRESQGVELRDISAKTKIGVAYLTAIEADDFGGLPAEVYVRGFLAEVAKFLGLDADQVSRTYVRRYKRFIEERESRF